MTDVLTPSVRERAQQESEAKARSGKKRILAAAVLVGALAGGGIYVASQPDWATIEQTRWEQVVSYYENRFGSAGAGVRDEAAHWQAVVDYYEEQWAKRGG